MSDHSYLPPSGAASWVACHAWPMMNMLYPNQDTEDSLEGQEAHAEASKCLESYQQQEGEIYIPNDPNVRIYTGHVLKSVETFGGLRSLHVEQRVSMPTIHADCHGTPDAWAFDASSGVLHVYEYKHGHGVVDVFENWQLASYASGIISELELSDTNLTVEYHLVQPRAHHPGGAVRCWKFRADNLRGQINQLHYAAGMIMSDQHEKKTTPGKHCTYCPGRHACPSAERFAASAVHFASLFELQELEPDQLGRELTNIDAAITALEARRTGIAPHVESLLASGVPVPEWELEDVSGRSKWTAPVDEVYLLGDLYGVSLRITNAPTPTQARDAFIAQGIDGAVIDAYSARSKSRKLKQSNPAQLRHIFGVSQND